MSKTRHFRRSVAVVLASGLVAITAACGGSDSSGAGDETPADEPAEGEAVPADDDSAADDGGEGPDESPAEPAEAVADAIDDAVVCLQAGGFAVSDGDEASTGLSTDMMANLGIDRILVFDDGAGSAGTIEAYASAAQADLAAEGYEGSPLGYSVGRNGDVVFKTPGNDAVLSQIDGCLAGIAIEAVVEGPSDDETSEAGDGGAEGGDGDVDDDGAMAEDSAEEADVDEGEAGGDAAAEETAPAVDMSGAQAGLVDILINDDLEAQDVFFVRSCLEEWASVFSQADAELLLESGGAEVPGVSPEALAHAETVFGCLDLERLAVVYAEGSDVDVTCIDEQFATVDVDAVVAEGGASIDVIFQALGDAAFNCE